MFNKFSLVFPLVSLSLATFALKPSNLRQYRVFELCESSGGILHKAFPPKNSSRKIIVLILRQAIHTSQIIMVLLSYITSLNISKSSSGVLEGHSSGLTQ